MAADAATHGLTTHDINAPGIDAHNTDLDRAGGDRIFRLVARLVGAGFVAYFFACLSHYRLDSTIVASWWTPVALPLTFLPGIAVGLLSFGPIRGIRIAGLVCGVSYAVVVLLWFIARNGSINDGRHMLWVASASGLVTIVVAISVPLPWGYCYMVGAVSLVIVANRLSHDGPQSLDVLFLDILANNVFVTIWQSAALAAISAGRFVDRSRINAYRAAAAAAADKALVDERTRLDAFVHDNVLATLLAIIRSRDDNRLPEQTRSTLRRLDQIRDGQLESAMPLASLVARARARVGHISDAIQLEWDGQSGDRMIPSDVVDAITEATLEALRNSVRHAGHDGVSRVIAIDGVGPDVSVTVTDDGRGFDPATVPPERLGIALSIRARMSRLPGGRAEVSSAPGQGTVVSIAWNGES